MECSPRLLIFFHCNISSVRICSVSKINDWRIFSDFKTCSAVSALRRLSNSIRKLFFISCRRIFVWPYVFDNAEKLNTAAKAIDAAASGGANAIINEIQEEIFNNAVLVDCGLWVVEKWTIWRSGAKRPSSKTPVTVSYTHLTLPTICSV